jgi:hypothetical protein
MKSDITKEIQDFSVHLLHLLTSYYTTSAFVRLRPTAVKVSNLTLKVGIVTAFKLFCRWQGGLNSVNKLYEIETISSFLRRTLFREVCRLVA